LKNPFQGVGAVKTGRLIFGGRGWKAWVKAHEVVDECAHLIQKLQRRRKQIVVAFLQTYSSIGQVTHH